MAASRDAEFTRLSASLEEFRDRTADRSVTEADAFALLEDVEHMLDKASGTARERDLRAIYSLLACVWENLRATASLRRR